MADKRQAKSPVGAAMLSIIPGLGFFYVGNKLKGIAHVLVMAFLIVLMVEGTGNDRIIFLILITGFYIYQIFDSFDEAGKTKKGLIENGTSVGITLFWSLTIVAIGVLFQLANLDIIKLRSVAKLWPVALIVFGAKHIYNYYLTTKEGGEHE
ncbi:MAG: hypothetical protein KAW12_26405 [Candidatus Aminicenantes bacterium]|nr:hypothetical protein [Candidatus Aminicenantes bacterium]